MTLELQRLMSESQTMTGPLGAIAYGVLKGMEVGGADAKAVAAVRVLLHEHLVRVSDADCNVLCDLVYQRLQTAAARGQPWYQSPAKT